MLAGSQSLNYCCLSVPSPPTSTITAINTTRHLHPPHPVYEYTAAAMGSDPQYASYPNLHLSQHIFTLRQPKLSALHPSAHKVLTASIAENAQAPLYHYLANPVDGILQKSIQWDESLYAELKKKNDDELNGYDQELEEAEEKAGESEIVEAMGKKAEFWARVVDKVGEARWCGLEAGWKLTGEGQIAVRLRGAARKDPLDRRKDRHCPGHDPDADVLWRQARSCHEH